jgi:hypothetical protein
LIEKSNLAEPQDIKIFEIKHDPVGVTQRNAPMAIWAVMRRFHVPIKKQIINTLNRA